MKLMVSELTASNIDQVVTPEKNTIVEAIRPHLYRHNMPTGSLKLQIRTAADALVAESEVINISDIGSLSYFHGYIRFYINAYLQKNVPYTIRLIGQGGYTFTESAYIGWCGGFDLGKYPVPTVIAESFNQPLDLEIWERTEK